MVDPKYLRVEGYESCPSSVALTFAPIEVSPEALSLGLDPSMNWPMCAARLGLFPDVHPLLLKVLVVRYLAM